MGYISQWIREGSDLTAVPAAPEQGPEDMQFGTRNFKRNNPMHILFFFSFLKLAAGCSSQIPVDHAPFPIAWTLVIDAFVKPGMRQQIIHSPGMSS